MIPEKYIQKFKQKVKGVWTIRFKDIRNGEVIEDRAEASEPKPKQMFRRALHGNQKMNITA